MKTIQAALMLGWLEIFQRRLSDSPPVSSHHSNGKLTAR